MQPLKMYICPARSRKLTLVILFLALALPTFGKSPPPPPPPTLQEKVAASPFIVLGQVERVNYMILSGPRTYKLLDYLPQDFQNSEQPVLSIKVLEVLKEASDIPIPKHLSLFANEQSGTREAFRNRYIPGSQWVIFLRPSEGQIKSDPPEFFGKAPEYRIPHHRQTVHPEPLDRLKEISQLLPSATPR